MERGSREAIGHSGGEYGSCGTGAHGGSDIDDRGTCRIGTRGGSDVGGWRGGCTWSCGGGTGGKGGSRSPFPIFLEKHLRGSLLLSLFK